MTPAQLSDAVLRTARDGLGVVAGPEAVALRRAPHGRPGWATPVALRLAATAGRDARDVARVLRDGLLAVPGVRTVEITGTAFLTIAVDDEAGLLTQLLARPRPTPLPEDPARDIARWAAATGTAPGPGLLVQRDGNPLFRVRHAHARSRAVTRAADALGVTPEPGAAPYDAAERALLALLGERPPVRPAPWLDQVARAFAATGHGRAALPVGDGKPTAVHRARLALAQATGTVLADGLLQLGISAPDHM
ncbi:DALR anticodon-binding domain-containing protein [Streptomyces avicenniae]|uniref:DALR anticodon-binding domain-containing protein n=1 Tax=Streptomyces avicenniae TaxID=500153 RepID=UPI00069BF3D5|nr:DALR anticodon-binding domain-containing protein [Streptomyces avicenniae]